MTDKKVPIRYDVRRAERRISPKEQFDGDTYRVWVLDDALPISVVTIGDGPCEIDVGVCMN